VTGASTSSSMRRTYLIACAGNSPQDRAPRVDPDQPSITSYSGVAAACARLIQGRLVDPFDQAAGRLRMSAASVAVAGGSLEAQRRRHADVVHAAIHPRTSHPDKARQYIPEVMPAFRWATKADWNLAGKLARQGYTYFRNHGRLAEGVELLIALRNAAELREDWQVSDECDWELSWVRNTPYRGADRGPVEGDQLSFSF